MRGAGAWWKTLSPLLLLVCGGGGCAHYGLPASQLETPEARGRGPVAGAIAGTPAVGQAGLLGRLELAGLIAGTDLSAPMSQGAADEETGEVPAPTLQLQPVGYGLGFVVAADDRIDLGVRIQPYAPLLLRGKLQLAGEPESRARQGNLAVAAAASAGGLLGAGEVSYFLGNISLPVGYRLWQEHLFSVTPFFSFASLSNIALAPPPGQRTMMGSASALQYGGALGYQYTVMSLFLRGEVEYLRGSFNEGAIAGMRFGLIAGFLL